MKKRPKKKPARRRPVPQDDMLVIEHRNGQRTILGKVQHLTVEATGGVLEVSTGQISPRLVGELHVEGIVDAGEHGVTVTLP
jgi:hypothetical protein